MNGAAVLDIGCGTGVPIAKSLAKRFSVTGVDASEKWSVERGRMCQQVSLCAMT